MDHGNLFTDNVNAIRERILGACTVYLHGAYCIREIFSKETTPQYTKNLDNLYTDTCDRVFEYFRTGNTGPHFSDFQCTLALSILNDYKKMYPAERPNKSRSIVKPGKPAAAFQKMESLFPLFNQAIELSRVEPYRFGDEPYLYMVPKSISANWTGAPVKEPGADAVTVWLIGPGLNRTGTCRTYTCSAVEVKARNGAVWRDWASDWKDCDAIATYLREVLPIAAADILSEDIGPTTEYLIRLLEQAPASVIYTWWRWADDRSEVCPSAMESVQWLRQGSFTMVSP